MNGSGVGGGGAQSVLPEECGEGERAEAAEGIADELAAGAGVANVLDGARMHRTILPNIPTRHRPG
jgi:hypothetical protein